MSLPLGVILNRSSTLDEVKTWVIPHCSIEESTSALAGRVIEVDRDLAAQGNRQVGDGGGNGRGNHQPDMRRRAPLALEHAAEHERAQQVWP